MLEVSGNLLAEGWKVIAGNEEIVAFHKSNVVNADRVVVSFDSLDERSYLLPSIKSSRTVAGIGADQIQISCNVQSWYQIDNIAEFLSDVERRCSFYNEVITYGHSMGGYGALMLSGILKATRVVAFAPQFSVDPLKTPFDNRFIHVTESLRFFNDDLQSMASKSASFALVYDPAAEIDRRHITEIEKRIKNVRRIPLPFAGHYPGDFLRQIGMLRPISSKLLLGRDLQDEWPIMRRRRRNSLRYMVERAMHLGRKQKLRAALDAVNAAYIIAPDSPTPLEAFHAVLQGDTIYAGLSHAILRLIVREMPAWADVYAGSQTIMLDILQQRVARMYPEVEER